MESSMEFSQELAASLYQSTDSFPVDFSKAVEWLGYTRKDSAKEKLVRNFEKDVDYSVRWRNVPHSQGFGASRVEEIFLTIKTLKSIGMMVGTEQGKKIREYFLECEKVTKQITTIVDPILLEVLTSMQKEMKILSIRTQRLDAIDKATDTHKGLAGVVETEVMEIYPDILSYTVKEYLQMKGVSEEHLHTMRKRAVMFANQGKQTKLPTKGKEYVFVGNDISYLDQALKTVLGLD